MSYISSLKNENDVLTFDLNNNSKEIKISLVNSIRRIIISDIETYIIDNKNVTFYENSSMLNNEFLKHRLSLIPIISNLDNTNYENLVISCKKSNDSENMESIYVSDFECKDSIKGEIIDNNLIFKYPKILFGKIKNGQNVSFEGKLTKNNLTHGGAFFSPVSACIYTFKIDEEKVKEVTENMTESEKITFNTLENERIYIRNDNGEPNVYQFHIESIGFYDSLIIFNLGINLLINKLNIIKLEIRNKKSKKVISLENIDNPDFYDFLIDGENETLGNLLSTYITYDSNVFYCGYVIEHPLKKNIILRIKLNSDNTEDNSITVIEQNIDIIINILNKINNEVK